MLLDTLCASVELSPLYDKGQLTSEVIGFPTPNQLADLTLAELEDLVELLTPVLTPIFGTIGILRYLNKPLSITAQIRSVSILTFVKNKRPDSYADVVREGLTIQVPRMSITIKPEAHHEENLVGFLKTRGKSCQLSMEHEHVNWYGAPIDRHVVPIRYG